MRGSLLLVLLLIVAGPLAAQVAVHPTGVNVNTHGATTVFLTFGGLRPDQVPVEAFWCGELIPAPPPAFGQQCDPATLFGQLPIRFDLSQTQGGAFTDIMSIPPSVSRRAYQAAVEGDNSAFFYVRRFMSTTGGPDEFVAVTCRLSSGGARTPFALTNVELAFDVETPVLYVLPGETPPPLAAEISYNGTGRLEGRWEIVLPGDELPEERDLLTEGTLPPEERGTQRLYTQIERFNHYLPPSGRFTLPGPDPTRLPTEAEGGYMILLRIEAFDDKEAESNRALAGASGGVVVSGAVAGFPMPTLRYFVTRGGGSELAELQGTGELSPLAPADSAVVALGTTVDFRWGGLAGAGYYQIDVESGEGVKIMTAVVPAGVTEYASPSWLAERAPSGTARWRVVALDLGGQPIRESAWRQLVVVQPQ